MQALLAVLLFLAGAALGALLVLRRLSPGPWPPERRAHAKRGEKERESWLR
jgi:hypothetical protein